MANGEQYKDSLMEHANLVDRTGVVAINPHALEESEVTTFRVTGTLDDGTVLSSDVSVHVDLNLAVTTGLSNVPINVPVLLHAKESDVAYSWSISGPGSPTLDLDSSRNPVFTPTTKGEFVLSDLANSKTFSVFAGEWVGAISGMGPDGKPTSGCEMCHNGNMAPDNFSEWRNSGHAEIFSVNFNTSGHYSTSCLGCHTVGYDPLADNNGFDDGSFDAFMETYAPDGAHFSPDPDNWANMLDTDPSVAKKANIQCENCHGPNDSSQHGHGGESRVSIASELCGSCHGEPTRHARYQQWQLSKHSDFELAMSRGTRASCAKCHSGQGFIAWVDKVNTTGDTSNLTSADVTWDADTVQPQTCVTCHDPHSQGTTSGEPNTATVRVEGNTPMLDAGFRGVALGKGALCVTCHNSRRGLRNDSLPVTELDRAPHGATQGDVLLGENLYFVEVGQRSPHSMLGDTCTNCHLVQTNPPAKLSNKLSGTNHTFAASMDICSNCHGEGFDGEGLQGTVASGIEEVASLISKAYSRKLATLLVTDGSFVLKGAIDPVGGGTAASNVSLDQLPSHIEVESSHGRTALMLDLDSPVTVNFGTYTATVSELEVQLGKLVTFDGSTPVLGVDTPVAKAQWNYWMLSNDGSLGAHNPGLTFEVLGATYNELVDFVDSL